MCEKAGFPGFYTNHSLRANGATHLYNNCIEEQLIQEFTGHRSVAVREYKRTSERQCRMVSKCVMGQLAKNNCDEFVPMKRIKLS